MVKKTTVINFFGGPGAGKTTCALEIAAELKKHGYTADYVQEYAKELVYDGKIEMLSGTVSGQKHLLEEQRKRTDRLLGSVDFVLTDSPILLNPVYLKEYNEEYENYVTELFKSYSNINVFIERGNNFEESGRIHNLQESINKDKEIKALLDKHSIPYTSYSHETVKDIVKTLIQNEYQQEKAIESTISKSLENEFKQGDVIYANVPLENGESTKRLLYINEVMDTELKCLQLRSLSETTISENKNVTLLRATKKNNLKSHSILLMDTVYSIPKSAYKIAVDISIPPDDIETIAAQHKLLEKERKVKTLEAIKEKTPLSLYTEALKVGQISVENIKGYKELIEFSAQFPQFSTDQLKVIYTQAPGAEYLLRADEWKEKFGCDIKKEHCTNSILVPVNYPKQYYKSGDELIPLETGAISNEMAMKISQNKVQLVTQTEQILVEYYDISQTNLPKDKYPEIISWGVESVTHAVIYEQMKEFANQNLGLSVQQENIPSTSIIGYFNPASETIVLSDNLDDTGKLVALTHEVSHAFIHKTSNSVGVKAEFEAECLNVMLHKKLGLELPQRLQATFASFTKMAAQENTAFSQKSLKCVTGAFSFLQENFIEKKLISIAQEQIKQMNKEPALKQSKENINFLQQM